MIRIFFIACKFTFFPRSGQMLPLFFVVIIANGVFRHHMPGFEGSLREAARTDTEEEVYKSSSPSSVQRKSGNRTYRRKIKVFAPDIQPIRTNYSYAANYGIHIRLKRPACHR